MAALSIEYRTLIECTPVLVSEISLDTSTVAQALLAKGLIPPNKREADAGFLVGAITNKVKLRTQNYYKFMDILKEQPWLTDLHDILEDKYRELAGGANKGKESKQDSSNGKGGGAKNGGGGNKVDSSDTLDIDDLRTVNSAIYDTRVKWDSIGLELNVDPGTIAAIRKSHQREVGDCLTEVLTEWLKRLEPPPTWTELANALKQRTVGYPKVAKDIMEKFVH